MRNSLAVCAEGVEARGEDLFYGSDPGIVEDPFPIVFMPVGELLMMVSNVIKPVDYYRIAGCTRSPWPHTRRYTLFSNWDTVVTSEDPEPIPRWQIEEFLRDVGPLDDEPAAEELATGYSE